MPREQELEFLKTEAQALREELKELENRIAQLSAEKE
jgi:polyhydroxyalkanoate synthesis regulator phasin